MANPRIADERRSSYVQGVDERGDEPFKEGGRVVDGGSGAVRGAGQVRGVNPVGGCQSGHNPSPVEGVVAGAMQQHERWPYTRSQIVNGHPIHFNAPLFYSHIHPLGPVISPSFLREHKCAHSFAWVGGVVF